MKDIIKRGDKYGRLTAIKFNHQDKNANKYWLFRCSCGNEKVILVVSVKNGNTRSCGCLRKERATAHGMAGTRTYDIWAGMKERCNNKQKKEYKHYGGRGIKVCNHWNKFENFYKDMGKAPEHMSIDRINNNGNYEPNNCRWATGIEQANNRRSNHLLTYKGKTQTITQWAGEIGINKITLSGRINSLNWTVERALTTKTKKYEKLY